MKIYIPTTSIFLSEEKIFDDQIRWEYLKYEIRKFSIHFFISEAKKRRYGKTRVMSYELRVTSYELRVESLKVPVQIHELRVQIHKLQILIHELQVQINELRIQIHDLRVQIHKFKNHQINENSSKQPEKFLIS